MFASPVHVEQVNEVFPALFEAAYVRGKFFGSGELDIVVENFVLEPLQVEYGLALARIEALDHALALLVAKLGQSLAIAVVNEPTVERARGDCGEVRAFRDERGGQRDGRPSVGRGDGEARHAPEVDGLHQSFLQVFETN